MDCWEFWNNFCAPCTCVLYLALGQELFASWPCQDCSGCSVLLSSEFLIDHHTCRSPREIWLQLNLAGIEKGLDKKLSVKHILSEK